MGLQQPSRGFLLSLASSCFTAGIAIGAFGLFIQALWLWPFSHRDFHLYVNKFPEMLTDSPLVTFPLICFVASTMLIIGSIGLRRRREWARRLLDIFASAMMVGLIAFCGFETARTIQGDRLGHLRIVFWPAFFWFPAILVAVAIVCFDLRERVWQDSVVEACGGKPALVNAKRRRIRAALMLVFAICGGAWLGLRFPH